MRPIRALTYLVVVLCAVAVNTSAYKLIRTTPKIPPPELPPGESLKKFALTCEYCGDVFGFDYTYKCLYDPSYQTYKDCLVGLSKK